MGSKIYSFKVIIQFQLSVSTPKAEVVCNARFDRACVTWSRINVTIGMRFKVPSIANFVFNPLRNYKQRSIVYE